MKRRKPRGSTVAQSAHTARVTTGEDGGKTGPRVVPELEPKQRWSASRKRDVVLRLLKGEPLDAVSRAVGVEMHRLERWRDEALDAMELGFTKRQKDGRNAELDAALKRVGELSMENELLRMRCEKDRPFAWRRSTK